MLLATLLSLGACASDDGRQRAESDPWEPLNRGMYKFNDVLDRATLKPVARGYTWLIPSFARRGVTNFRNNLTTPSSAVNNFLQGKPKQGLSEVTRFLFNSTIGTFGQDQKKAGESRTILVIAITATMMVVEIAAGMIFGSMALLADGLHMASHAAALSIAAAAYVYARRHAHDRRFSFGTGKVNALGGFSGAILLAMFAILMVCRGGLDPVG